MHSNCTDYDVLDCQNKLLDGNCNNITSNGFTLGYMCPNSCNLCQRQNCQFFEGICGSFGTCIEVSYFNISTVECNCNSGYLGAWCNMCMLKITIFTFKYLFIY